MVIISVRLHLSGRRLMCIHNKGQWMAFSAASASHSLIIERQIKMAKAQLIAVGSPEKHYPVVEAALDEGRVKPFFHTIFLPETFLGNQRSSGEVTSGDVDQTRTLRLDNYGENLNEAVDSSGYRKAARSIRDRWLGESWDFDHRQTAFAVELVNTDAEMLGEGIECTDLKSIPIEVSSSGAISNKALMTRPESRGVVSNSFHRFTKRTDAGFVAAITGSPGIGKSWTLLYALQQALLYDGANVLFFFQKKSSAVMYLRRENKIYAWKSPSRGVACSNLFERSDVLVLLDPKEAKQGGANFSLGRQKLLYAASNNEQHFTSSAEKEYGKIQAFLGPPLDSELYVILHRLDPNLPRVVIEERKENVGNLIRYILDEEKYMHRVDATNKAVDQCAGDEKLFEQVLRDEGMSDGHKTIPGTLFEVLPSRPDDGFLGYDGQEVKYRERVVRAANDNVRNAILKAGRKPILSYWAKVEGDELATMGRKVESLFIKNLTSPDGMVMKRYLQATTKGGRKESNLVVESDLEVEKNVPMDAICSAVLKKKNVVAKVAKRGELIDAAGPERKVYQVTVSLGHRFSLEAMENLGRELGYIDQDGTITPKNTIGKLEFHWTVPMEIASVWKGKAPFRFRTSGDKERTQLVNLVNKCLDAHVDMYILPLTTETPITFAEWKSGKKPW